MRSDWKTNKRNFKKFANEWNIYFRISGTNKQAINWMDRNDKDDQGRVIADKSILKMLVELISFQLV